MGEKEQAKRYSGAFETDGHTANVPGIVLRYARERMVEQRHLKVEDARMVDPNAFSFLT